jgi:precorrin-6x reductase
LAEVVVFGGTSEGRAIANALREKDIPALVCVATQYGQSLAGAGGSVAVHTGRLDARAMAEMMRTRGARLVIDATHPHAREVSGNIRAACADMGLRHVRVERERASDCGDHAFSSMDALIEWLNAADGMIFSTLGANQAHQLTAVAGFDRRVWLRILPFAEGLNACLHAGFPAARIICMQGPFSEELNAAMFRAAGADILVTKESGAAGGYDEKLRAARACGMTVAVLTRPDEGAGHSLQEVLQMIEGGAI